MPTISLFQNDVPVQAVSQEADTCKKIFIAFCLLHLLFWTLGPSLVRGNAPFDSIEGLVWGNQWQWGYSKHPFLAPWLTALVTRLGGSVGWPIYLLSQISIVTCFWAVWRLAQKFLSSRDALISVMLLEGIYYYNVASPQFNPNVLMLPLWALTTLTFYNALTSQKNKDWAWVGLFSGLAMLAKYQSLLLYAAMLFVMLSTSQGKNALRKTGPYLAATLFLILFLPNLIWLIHNNLTALSYAAERVSSEQVAHWFFLLNNVFHPAKFALEQLGALLPMFILFIPLFRCERDVSHFNRFDQRFLFIMGLGPLVFTLLISLSTGIWLHSLWGIPLFSLSGILLFAGFRPKTSAKAFKQFLLFFGVLFCLIFVVRFGFLLVGPALNGQTNSAQFPGKEIARVLSQEWQKRFHRSLRYVAGSRTLVENISAYSSDQPIPYFEWDKTQSGWIDEADLRHQGALFVWFIKKEQDKQLPAEVKKRFPNVQLALPIIFHDLANVKNAVHQVGVAYLPPN